MSSSFKLGKLSLRFPPSIPLIIRGDHQWVDDKLSPCQREDNGGHGGAASLKVVPVALEILSTITKPLAVLSICGPFRTGKSFLMSRIMGRSGAFKVGHTFDPCTKCVWMSTSILECDEFVVVFIDTEGMDALEGTGEDEASVSKQMIVTVLMSSLLIYNSSTVPEWSDLEDMSVFSELSSSIITKSTEEDYSISDYFPKFLWLIRDVALQFKNEDGDVISPKEYLKSRVLVRSSNHKTTKEDYIVSALLKCFPSIECQALPRPSSDPKIITDMENNFASLDENFKAELQSFIDFVFQKIKECDIRCNSGDMLADLVQKFVSLVNADKDLELHNTYSSAAESVLFKLADRYTEEYASEMEERLKNDYPIEEVSVSHPEQSLLGIHKKVMLRREELFEKEIDRVLCISQDDNNPDELQKKNRILADFRIKIFKLSEDQASPRIVGGALYQFALENLSRSRESCKELVLAKFKGVSQMIEDAALQHSEDIDITSVVLEAEKEYYDEAIGPAKEELYNEYHRKLMKSYQQLADIPKRPTGLVMAGVDKDRVMLRWEASHNESTDCFELQYTYEKDTWNLLPERHRDLCATVDGLKSNTTYMFKVRIKNSKGIDGNWSLPIVCNTMYGSLARGAAIAGSFVGGSLASPAMAIMSMPIGGPLSLAAGLVAAPITGTVFAMRTAKDCGPQGELRNDRTRAEVGGNDREDSFGAQSQVNEDED